MSFLERTRTKYLNDPKYLKLLREAEAAQEKLKEDYPQLFADDEFQKRNQARQELKKDPAFTSLMKARSEAYENQQRYLYQNDRTLKSLKLDLDFEKSI